MGIQNKPARGNASMAYGIDGAETLGLREKKKTPTFNSTPLGRASESWRQIYTSADGLHTGAV